MTIAQKGGVPDWAIERALQVLNEGRQQARVGSRWHDGERSNVTVVTLARYIADHEEPPVDPLLIEARQIAADAIAKGYPDTGSETILRIREGHDVDYAAIDAALAGIRRGIEIGGGK